MSRSSPHHYEPGQALFYEGNPPLAVHCIQAGEFKLWRTGHAFEQQVVATRRAGSLTGYRAVLVGRPYTATAEALVRSTACTIPGETFMEALRESPELSFAVLTRLAEGTLEIEEHLVNRALERVQQRTARFLVHSLPPDACDGPVSLPEPVTRTEMAHLVGTTPETLSRTLHALAESGVLALGRREIRVLDVARLRRIAE